MTPETRLLLQRYTNAVSNELIAGEAEHTSMSTLRHYQAATEVHGKAFIAQIEKLERGAGALATFVGQIQDAGIENDNVAMGGADTVQWICEAYPTLKAALK